MKQPTKCKECGSTHLSWDTSIVNRSDVQHNRLSINDVQCIFFLGCDECSETLMIVSADKIAAHMNGYEEGD